MYLGGAGSNEGSQPEILSRIAQIIATLKRLNPVWNDSSLSSKIRLMRFLVTSIFLCACEFMDPHSRAAKKNTRHANEVPCFSYKDHVINGKVCPKIQQAIGPHDDFLTIVKRRKLKWYEHVSHSSGLAKTILQGAVKEGKRQGRQKKKKKGGKTTSGNGQAWCSPNLKGQWKTAKNGGNWL